MGGGWKSYTKKQTWDLNDSSSLGFKLKYDGIEHKTSQFMLCFFTLL